MTNSDQCWLHPSHAVFLADSPVTHKVLLLQGFAFAVASAWNTPFQVSLPSLPSDLCPNSPLSGKIPY